MVFRRLVLAALAAAAVLSAPGALAARGDKLYISLEDVALRDTPSADAPRVLVLDRGHMVVEVNASGRWLRVAAARTDGIMGWVMRRELTTLKPSPAPPLPRPAFEYFVTSVEKFNQDVLNETGYQLYSLRTNVSNANNAINAKKYELERIEDSVKKNTP